MTSTTRTETDSMGAIEVATNHYWGAQTERSRQNFRIGHDRMPMPIIRGLAIVKLAASLTNRELGLLDVTHEEGRAASLGHGPMGADQLLADFRNDLASCLRLNRAPPTTAVGLPRGRRRGALP